ncbi:DegT/DnrJ/EryC1/StrS family aminotransferase [Sphingobium sp. YC-XJ3]|uniref:DegT/DnrJ/EryC1/StrS family aminotransferase n=1 Tax=Sphingobium sp. YC-XJ3 TaxID=3024245 RepID=UPI002361697E|nr:DegT/DnrJ/EryC1/StrS family aminotransferase [Sphingobium sp. YC-XJ3]WDA38695.1 DegT/DnrJ/EryC1/StrS family aminotransferase [Sphingobium sp. YC-XJ3]
MLVLLNNFRIGLLDTSFPVSEDIARRGISLPSYPALTDGDVKRVVSVLKEQM